MDDAMNLLQEKFATLSLAFKTDRQTLEKRIELHQRARDIAETNIQKELEGLKDGMKVRSPGSSVIIATQTGAVEGGIWRTS